MSAQGAGRMAWAALALAAALLTGASAATAAETAIQFSLDRRIDGTAAPFLLPLDRGWYRAEDVNVSVEPATSMVEPITRVASGNFDMGLADINALIKYRDANPKAPVKAVFMLYNRPAYAVIGRKSRGIAGPKDLEGKKLGMPPADPASAQWPIFAKINGIDTSKVTVESIATPVREPMLAAGQVDAVTGLSYSLFIDLKDKGVPVNDITVLAMADYGLALYGQAIIVNSAFAAKHPEAVTGFLRALLKGLKASVASPATAVEAVLTRNDALNKELERERLTMVIADDILTPEVKAHGYGSIDDARFARAVEQLALAYQFKGTKPKPADVFDASYLPPAAERAVR
jgi:NitT/TauT family transport system substrate-binding protein